MRIMSVVGARPQFVKLAPIAHATERAGIEHVIVHTGQHYDRRMSESFFDDLGVPSPDVNLRVGSATHAVQVAEVMIRLEPHLTARQVDWVLVYGDTNSTLGAALCSTKLGIPTAHLEAGLRSFNRAMPEEHNRVLTDHAADLCLAPTDQAMAHLSAEGLASRSVVVGDVMMDVLYKTREVVRRAPVASPISTDAPFVLATLHRPSNCDDADRLRQILRNLAQVDVRVFLAAHPRLIARSREFGLDLELGSISTVPPLDYPQLVQALDHAVGVVTDSGGLQKEAYAMEVPTTTVRSETEWVETLCGGWNVLSYDPVGIAALAVRPRPVEQPLPVYGDGSAAAAVTSTLAGADLHQAR